MNKDNNKNQIVVGVVYGGIVGFVIGIITFLGQHNDSFVYMYAAPFYIYSYMFDGIRNESIAISVYYCAVGLCIGYFYSASKFQKNKLLTISAVILLHIILTVFSVKAISKDLKEFLNNIPAEMIVDAISSKDEQ